MGVGVIGGENDSKSGAAGRRRSRRLRRARGTPLTGNSDQQGEHGLAPELSRELQGPRSCIGGNYNAPSAKAQAGRTKLTKMPIVGAGEE